MNKVGLLSYNIKNHDTSPILFTERLVTTPALLHPSLALGLYRVLLRHPKREIAAGVGQELLFYKMAGIIVRIFVPVGITEFGHKFCGCVAQM